MYFAQQRLVLGDREYEPGRIISGAENIPQIGRLEELGIVKRRGPDAAPADRVAADVPTPTADSAGGSGGEPEQGPKGGGETAKPASSRKEPKAPKKSAKKSQRASRKTRPSEDA